jgi:hypothetical protein
MCRLRATLVYAKDNSDFVLMSSGIDLPETEIRLGLAFGEAIQLELNCESVRKKRSSILVRGIAVRSRTLHGDRGGSAFFGVFGRSFDN